MRQQRHADSGLMVEGEIRRWYHRQQVQPRSGPGFTGGKSEISDDMSGREEKREGRGDATVGGFVLNLQEDRLVVRQRWGEYGCGCVVCLLGGPLCALLAVGLIQSEIRDSGWFLKALHVHELGLRHLGPAGWLFKLLSITCSLALTAFLAWVSLMVFRELYRMVVYGRRPWVFDRSRDLLMLGDTPMGQLSFIKTLSLDRQRGRGGFTYYVSLQPEPFLLDTREVFKGPRWHVFAFGNRKDARAFAEKIASFLRVEIVIDLE